MGKGGVRQGKNGFKGGGVCLYNPKWSRLPKKGGGSGGHLNGKYFNAEEEEAWDIASACMHLFFFFSGRRGYGKLVSEKGGEGEEHHEYDS